MNNDITMPEYLKTGIGCAIGYCIPLLFFFKNEQSSAMWILYIGNIIFMMVIILSAGIINKRLHDETSVIKMFTIGAKLNIASILVTIPFVVVLFYLFGHRIIPSSTANNTYGSTLLLLLMNVVLVNLFMGSFAVLLAALIYSRYPKNSKGEDIT